MVQKFLLLILTVIMTAGISYADGFNSIHTPDGINVIAVGDNGNVFRSSNGGSTWAAYTVNPSSDYKSVFSINDDVWIASSGGNVYKTLKVNSPFESHNVGISAKLNSVYFINSSTGFVCGNEGAVYKTINGGTNWTLSNSGISGTDLNSISFKDGSNGVTAGANGAIYITTNGGASWSAVASSTTRNLLKVKYFSDGYAIAGEYGTLLIKPAAGSLSAVSTRINTDIRGVSGINISNIAVCGGGGFIRNNRNGSSNFLNFEINPMFANLVDIFYYDSNTGFAVSSLNNAIIKTTNGGNNWELPLGAAVSFSWQSKPGATGSFLGDNLCVHPTNRNTIFTNFSGRTYVSRNRGESWSQIGTQIPSTSNTPHSFYVSPVDTNIFICAIEASPDKIVRSTDYGQTWNTIMSRNFSNYGEPLQIDQNNPGTFYFGPDNGGFYKSTDNGATFTEISNNYPFRSPCDIMVTYDAPNIIFVADGITSSGLADIFKSTNGGLNWTKVFTNPSSSEIPTMSNTVFDNTIAWCTNWSGNNIFKTTNTGDNWTLSHSNTFSGWGSDICKEDPNFIMTGSWSGGSTSMSTNGGINWINTTGLTGAGGVMKLIDRGYVIGQAGSSVYKLNIIYTVLTNVNLNFISSETPQKYNLYQNFPNPFNPSTNIRFDIVQPGNVVLKVYNQLGKEIRTLIDEYKAPGVYEVSFDAGDLSSGIYFYRLVSDSYGETGRFVSSKKMLLIK